MPPEDGADSQVSDELECKICYNRFETCLPDDEVSSLPDDNNILVNLTG
ncbi:E3 ubiquitin-protein ligase RNF182 [Prionailurus iriomotensis]